MTVFVTPAEQELARLDLELGDRLGEAPDARMKAILNAAPMDPPPLAHERALQTQLELAERAGLMQAVTERSLRGVSNRAAVRQVLEEHPVLVGQAVLADLALAKDALGLIESREEEKARLMQLAREHRASLAEQGRTVVDARGLSTPEPLETSESDTEAHDRAR